MPTRVQGPDGKIIEFPDGVSQGEMERAMQAHYGAPNRLPDVHVTATPEELDAAQPRSFLQNLGRAAVMTGRSVVHGALSIPAMLNDTTLVPAINAVSKAVGSDYREAPSSQQLDSYLNKLGVPNPQPENATERVVSGIDRGLGGLVSGAGIGQVMAGAGTEALQGIGNALTSSLGTQMAATTVGAAGSELAHEAGYSAPVQVLAGLVGGVSPVALSAGRQALLSRMSASLTSPSQEVAELGRYAMASGTPLKASQVSSSKVAKLVDSVSSKAPFSGAQAFQQQQRKAFNRAVARTIGEDADAITPEVFSAAKSRIGASYDDLASRVNPQITTQDRDRLAEILNSAQQFGAEDSARAVSNLLDRINAQMINGALPGQAYKSLDSEIGDILRNGGEKGRYAGRVRDVLRDAFTFSASPVDRAQMALANRQYGNLKTIEPLVATDAVEGNISPAKLLGRITANKAGKSSMAQGNRGELGKLANVGQQFLKDQIPDSGTPMRTAFIDVLKNIGNLVTGVAVGSGAAGLPAAAMSAAGAIGGSRLIQAAMKNQELVNAILGQKSPSDIGRMLMLSADPTAQQVIQR